jgi:tetratricopeptide (TPR) repeat protein
MARRAFAALFTIWAISAENGFSQEAKTYTPSDTTPANAYFTTGENFAKAARYDSAQFYFQKAVAIYKKICAKSNQAIIWKKYLKSLNRLGDNFIRRDDYETALIYLNEALAAGLKKFGEKHAEIAETYFAIGSVYFDKVDHDKALEYHQKARDLYLRQFGENHLRIAEIYDEIGRGHYHKREYDNALKHYERSLEIKLRLLGENTASTARSYMLIGEAYDCKAEYGRAYEFLSKSLAIALQKPEASRVTIADNYLGLGGHFRLQGDYSQAMGYYTKALSIYLETLNPKEVRVGLAYDGLGESALRLGDFEKALSYIQKALIAFVPSFNESGIYINPRMEELGFGHFVLETVGTKAAAFFAYYAYRTKSLKDLEMSIATFKLVSELIDKSRSNYKTEGAKLFLAERILEGNVQAIEWALMLYQQTKLPQFKHQAFFGAEQGKSTVLWEALSESKAKKFSGIPAPLLEKERNLKISLIGHENQLLKEKGKGAAADSVRVRLLQDKFFAANQEYQRLIEILEKEFPRYYDLKYRTGYATVAEVQKYLDNETALLEYVVSARLINIFVITNSEFEVATIPLDFAFDQAVRQFYSAIKKVEKQPFLENGRRLYEVLIKPIEKHIAAKKHLVIIPQGLLYYLPFEALLTETTQTEEYHKLPYLVRQFNVSYHYTASLFLNSVASTAGIGGEGFVGFAPVFSEKSQNGYLMDAVLELWETTKDALVRSVTLDGKTLSPLPATETELRSISNLFREQKKLAKAYFHRSAKEEQLKAENLKAYRYVHFATHGLLDENEPKLSGLIFSQGRGPIPVRTACCFLRKSTIWN